uniref:C-type lectin domain-containing protein n=2 Tax=Dicentrarchus labrax TaxID=13489 RepID=A0A8P4GI52_DICLA
MRRLTVMALVCAIMILARADAETQPVKTPTSCPSDWTGINGRCFQYVQAALTWAEAEKKCLSMGANLASVHSANEYLEIQMIISRVTKGFGRTWLGGTDCQKEGVWLWSDGTPFDYHHCGKFDNRWWREHCLQMNFGENKCWNDVRCSRKLPAVCAKNP